MAHDGRSVGHLQVRGPAVVQSYFKKAEAAVDAGNWFPTGDVASIDGLGGCGWDPCAHARARGVAGRGGGAAAMALASGSAACR